MGEINIGDRDFKGVWIPRDIYLNQDLSWTEKILLIEMDSLDKGEGCWASNQHFSKFLGVSSGQIANLISGLRKRGWIIDHSFDGRKRYISLNTDFRKTLMETSGNPEGRVQEKLRDKKENSSHSTSTKPNNEDGDSPSNTITNTNRGGVSRGNSTLSENESDTTTDGGDDYQEVDIDGDGMPVRKSPPKQKKKDRKNELISIAEKQRGAPFGSRGKQLKYIKEMEESGFTLKDIGKRWARLRQQEYWQNQDAEPDFKNVADSFDKQPNL